MSNFVRTFARRKVFLDAISLGSSTARAAEAAGGKSGNFRAWAKADPDFKKDWDDAIEDGTDFLEDVAVQRAMDRSDPLMIMMLKARRPEKYDRGSKLELSGSVSVEGSKSKLLNRLAKLQAARGGALLENGQEAEQTIPEEAEEIKALPAPAEPVPADTPVVKRRRGKSADRGS